MTTSERLSPPVCDYEGSRYEQEFWQGQGRDYEDRVERIALRRLLPRSGRRVLEIGAGFGRLTNELDGYDQVVLLDYSRTMLARARARLGDGRYTYVAADVYRLPFAPGAFDAATMIRVFHHMSDPPAAVKSIREALSPGAAFVLEYANKRNLKAILRYALRRQSWSPYSLEPVEFVKLNYDFHPTYMRTILRESNFLTRRELAVSYFRWGILKRTIPAGVLASLDALIQPWMPQYSPSVFTLNTATGGGPDAAGEPLRFRCPTCASELHEESGVFVCASDGQRWGQRDGIYDFKEPLT